MQGLTLVGSGWHPLLFRAEIQALTGPIEVISPRVLYIPLIDSTLERLSRAALLDEVISDSGRYWVNPKASQEDLCLNIAEWAHKHLPEGSFAVRTRRLGVGIPGFSRSTIDKKVGSLVASESRPVDLETPKNVISVVISGPEDGPIHRDDIGQNSPIVVWGLSHPDWQRESYSGRAPTERPFFQPVSLDPRQARLLISLAHRRTSETETVIDPFCGTGGIAIEAALQGFETLASDLDPRMGEGTLEISPLSVPKPRWRPVMSQELHLSGGVGMGVHSCLTRLTGAARGPLARIWSRSSRLYLHPTKSTHKEHSVPCFRLLPRLFRWGQMRMSK